MGHEIQKLTQILVVLSKLPAALYTAEQFVAMVM